VVFGQLVGRFHFAPSFLRSLFKPVLPLLSGLSVTEDEMHDERMRMTRMRLGEQLLEPIRSGCSHIDWQSDDAEIVVDVEVSDRLGMLARRLCVYGGKPEAASSALKRAQAVIDRLAFLDSTLRLIEWDRLSNMAQIRGRPDETSGIQIQFFEIILGHDPSLLIHRRSAQETIPFYISNECFVRLIDELVSIVRL